MPWGLRIRMLSIYLGRKDRVFLSFPHERDVSWNLVKQMGLEEGML